MTLAKKSSQCTLFLLAVAFLLSGCAEREQTNSQFKVGRQALMQGRYDEAIKKLRGYLEEKPHGRLASRASFLIAKAQLGLGHYDEARRQFEQTIQNYGDSEEAHKSQYKLAMLSLIEGDREDARRRFRELTAKPSGTLVPEAAAMLRFLDAADKLPEPESSAAKAGEE